MSVIFGIAIALFVISLIVFGLAVSAGDFLNQPKPVKLAVYLSMIVIMLWLAFCTAFTVTFILMNSR